MPNKVISLDKFKRKKELDMHRDIPHGDDDDLYQRISNIRASLDRINALVATMKEESQQAKRGKK